MSYWNGAYNSTGASNLTYSANGTIIGSNNISSQSVSYASTAGSAGSATKATQDSDGNQINTTYAKKTDKISTFTNDVGYLTSHQSLSNYLSKDNLYDDSTELTSITIAPSVGTSARNYPLQLDKNGDLGIYVPWTNTNYYPTRTYTNGLQISSYSGAVTCQLYVPYATNTQYGTVKLGSATEQTVAANAVSSDEDRTYAIQKNSSGELVVNVPWVNSYHKPKYTGGLYLASVVDTTGSLKGLYVPYATYDAAGVSVKNETNFYRSDYAHLTTNIGSSALTFVGYIYNGTIYNSSGSSMGSLGSTSYTNSSNGTSYYYYYSALVTFYAYESSQYGEIAVVRSSSKSTTAPTFSSGYATSIVWVAGQHGYWSNQVLTGSFAIEKGYYYNIFASKLSTSPGLIFHMWRLQ